MKQTKIMVFFPKMISNKQILLQNDLLIAILEVAKWSNKENNFYRDGVIEMISSFSFSVVAGLLGNNVNVDINCINAGTAINQVRTIFSSSIAPKTPLYGITSGQRETDSNNRLILISKRLKGCEVLNCGFIKLY
jgi:hypothetical protein